MLENEGLHHCNSEYFYQTLTAINKLKIMSEVETWQLKKVKKLFTCLKN